MADLFGLWTVATGAGETALQRWHIELSVSFRRYCFVLFRWKRLDELSRAWRRLGHCQFSDRQIIQFMLIPRSIWRETRKLGGGWGRVGGDGRKFIIRKESKNINCCVFLKGGNLVSCSEGRVGGRWQGGLARHLVAAFRTTSSISPFASIAISIHIGSCQHH